MKKILCGITAIAGLALLAGCGDPPQTTSTTTEQTTVAPMSAPMPAPMMPGTPGTTTTTTTHAQQTN